MATASDYATVFTGALRVASGDLSGAVPAAAKLVDLIFEELHEETPPPGLSTDLARAAYRSGMMFLEAAQRAVAHGEAQRMREDARNARQALVEALGIAQEREHWDEMFVAEIHAQIGACEALQGDTREALHWMEQAYRLALPLAIAADGRHRFRLIAFLPPLADALTDKGSRVGYLGTAEEVASWLQTGAQVADVSKATMSLAAWSTNTGTQDAPQRLAALTGTGSPTDAQTASSTDRETIGESRAKRIDALLAADQSEETLSPRPPSPEELRTMSLRQAAGAQGPALPWLPPPAPAGFDMASELHRHRHAREAVMGSRTKMRDLEEVISQRKAILAAGGLPRTHRSFEDLLREI
jgi:hypothetical protein